MIEILVGLAVMIGLGVGADLARSWRASGRACDVARDHGHTGGQW